jgi:hypothetical protein
VAAFGRDRSRLKCEASPFDEKAKTITVVCPPRSVFSPIRVKFLLSGIDKSGWENIDLAQPQPVDLATPGRESTIMLCLPHQAGGHHWMAWREFAEIRRIDISEDDRR